MGLTWTTSLGVNLVIVADDKILEDKFQQDLMRVITNTAGVSIRFFTILKLYQRQVKDRRYFWFVEH